MNKYNVLIVDDEKPIRDFIRKNLDVRGYSTLVASNGLEALAAFNTNTVDLVILDIMMPRMDGLETIRRIRQVSSTPIIILSALGEEADKISSLNLGADDYLTKPFGVGELLARVQAVLRRSRWTEPFHQQGQIIQRIERGTIIANLVMHEVTVDNIVIDLTPTSLTFLCFNGNIGRILPHKTILKSVGTRIWRRAEYLRVYIGRLRQKIEKDLTNPRYL
jgi:two-component system KDP operon response regulator KdpE